MKRKNIVKKLATLATLVFAVTAIIGCGSGEVDKVKKNDNKSNNEVKNDVKTSQENLPTVTMNIKDYGTVILELYPEKAPNTVNNFISLVKEGFYDGLTFHRVIEDFMIQGGDPDGVGTGGPGYSIEGEFSSNGFNNDLTHTEGIISMARSMDPNSAGSQFFIMTSKAEHLDGEYAAFGKVISGLDIVMEISKVKTDSNDKPEKDVVIESMTVDTKGIEYKDVIKVKE